MSNGSPADYTDVTANIRSNVPNAAVILKKQYKTTTSYDSGTTNSSGNAATTFNISGATIGYRVAVTVTVRAATCSTSFTPS
jgi:uncharacterized membrane protein YjfL (UPF0719 family)